MLRHKLRHNKYFLIAVVALLFLTLFNSNLSLRPRKIPAGSSGGHLDSGYQGSNPMRWGLEEIKAPSAWEVTRGSESVTVAVIDSGIDIRVAEIRENMWVNEDEVPGDLLDNDHNGYVDDIHGWDFRDNDSNSLEGSPVNFHGTFVAGLIASVINDDSGMAGVAPEVNIMDLRFLDSGGTFYSTDWGKLARAINYAVANGADIVNLSFSASLEPSSKVRTALKHAVEKGVLVVGIAGNEGGEIGYFGSLEEVMTVGAVCRDLRPADFSNYGEYIEVSAPGVGVLSYLPSGKLARASGTSFAAPHVSGVAALIKSLEPGLAGREVREILKRTTRDIYQEGWDKKTGEGIVDANLVVSEGSGLN